MTQPDGDPRIDIQALGLPDTGKRPSAGGGELDTDFDRIVPLAAQYDLIQATNEEAQRDHFLGLVTVEGHGVARSENPDSKVTTSLVAVRIQGHEATVVPLELDGHELVMPLPENTGSQIGFFVGYDGGADMAAVLRQGDYPGIPLTTEARGADRQKEILIGMGGIKAEERDEATWAEQIALYDALGFAPSQTRGVFSKSHRADQYTTTWKSQRLVVVPDSMRDLVAHHDSFDVTKDHLQVMTYGTQPVREIPLFRSSNPYSYGGGFDDLGGATRSFGAKGLGVGFGSEYTQQARTVGIELKGLASAFQVKVAPRSK